MEVRKVHKIAIYSGVIPSTPFIENLIISTANCNHTVFLFGTQKRTSHYIHPNIIVRAIPSKWSLPFYFIINSGRLFIKNPNIFYALIKHIQNETFQLKTQFRLWIKYLPMALNPPDIFHVQWTNSAHEWMFLKALFGTKILISLRGVQINIAPKVNLEIATKYKQLFPHVDAFHAVSKAIAKESLQYGVFEEKIKVIYSGVDTTKIDGFKKTRYAVEQKLKILSIGRYNWVKGYNYALDGLNILSKRDLKFHYTIITNEIREEILHQINEYELDDSVTISNKLPQLEIFQLMKEVDVLLLPSVEEGVANVVLEAMALGLPVISSDCGGMSEIITDGENGLLFKNRNPVELSEKLHFFSLMTSEQRSQMAINARLTIEQNHTLDKLASEFHKLYLSVL